MKNKELLDLYDEILRLSREMLAFASRGDWDRLIELEGARAAIVMRLAKEESGTIWDESDLAMKGALIRAALEIDSEVKSLTETRMIELQGALVSVNNERKLSKVYDSGP